MRFGQRQKEVIRRAAEQPLWYEWGTAVHELPDERFDELYHYERYYFDGDADDREPEVIVPTERVETLLRMGALLHEIRSFPRLTAKVWRHRIRLFPTKRAIEKARKKC